LKGVWSLKFIYAYPQSGNLNSCSAVKYLFTNKPGLAEAYNSRSTAKHLLPNKPGLAEA
jgi:hypothetical protein